ncbi:proline dehydrogenase [Haloferax mediterranei ATCC 33500]|uniref:proline dehydrogenase n=1 Tax=Haloferax mediterranei (strain ATCC 33500 / DSM 1411 / JCM 8866 / NBRC 14739 / NCIMB 2177 / R-4) TaxID=523841 RepID=I3R3V4_HALMT|nr:proline dehydrogenase family protein [Haloferax mediterranei]AFK18914.1 proline dehydrogenase [Haloferax mediterranei ATCC 33500]AHZ21723.1 proline dehydrogenase [Haloferax mediterranei ATCC 33500]EMA03227.1 proline dehydrogenase [Haloferax mediterranei ATCC 33500]MDX5989007.1 proline dehydrogenase family protein [Haloferax mediterranei ATCC 33500]QCQ75400.1 proline dehydrogenase [Haloferax mediterranei ATCC 33500]
MIPPIANNFVAGETADSAVSHVESLNHDGIAGILNLLGEHYSNRQEADADADAYVSLVRQLGATNLDGCVSVKPSQIGLDVSDTAFRENLDRIVDAAADDDVFVWVDMEDYTTTDVTLDAVDDLGHRTDGNVGVCVQANLKRTPDDLARLADVPGKVRLVKGAYNEPASVAHKQKSKVDEVYRDLLEYMFTEFDDGVAVGSHDPSMIAHARDMHDQYGTPYEVQMLMGVRDDAQRDLADADIEMWQYVPYGDKWFQYFYRRVRERKENALFALRAVTGL